MYEIKAICIFWCSRDQGEDKSKDKSEKVERKRKDNSKKYNGRLQIEFNVHTIHSRLQTEEGTTGKGR